MNRFSATRPMRSGQAVFTMTLTRDVELIGYAKLRLWVEAEGSEDMDLFVNVSKIDSEGNPLPARVFGVADPGARGMLRVSHRELDEARSTPSEPLPHPSRGTTSQAGRDRGSGHRHMAYGHALARRTEALYHREGNFALMAEPIRWSRTQFRRGRATRVFTSSTQGRYDSYLLVP